MRQIFTNAGASALTDTLNPDGLSIYLEDTSMFPQPVVGDEFFNVTLVGQCEQRIEIVRVIENQPGCLKLDRRGQEDTVPQTFFPQDYCYHALTAGAIQVIVDSWQWYLGPFDEAPVEDNYGDPLREGHLYYQLPCETCEPPIEPQMLVWDGEAWRPFNPTIAGTQIANYTWQMLIDSPAPTILPWPDTYGSVPIDFDVDKHGIDLYLNGSKIIENIDPAKIPGDYTIDYVTDEITVLHDIQMGDIIECKVLLRHDDPELDHINRGETDASGFGFVATDNEVVEPEFLDKWLPTVARVDNALIDLGETIQDATMTWKGKWLPGEYNVNDVVRDGNWLTIATTTTIQRPAPQADGEPYYAMPDSPTMQDLTDVVEVLSGNSYTILEQGVFDRVRVWVPNADSHLFKVQVVDVTGTESLIYEIDLLNASSNSWNLVPIPMVVMTIGMAIRVQLITTAQVLNDQIEYSASGDFWTLNPQTFASIGGYLEIAGVPQAAQSAHAFGIEMYYQKAAIASEWDIMANSSGGGGGGGGGSGPLHTIADSPPDNAQGDNGDLWFQPVPVVVVP